MKVQFDSTLEEIAEVQLAFHSESKILRRTHYQAATLCAAVVFGVLLALTHRETLVLRIIFSGIFAAGAAVYYMLTYKKSMAKRARKILLEKLGDGPFPFSAELKDDGIHVEQNSTQILFPWKNVQGVEEQSDRVTIRLDRGGLIVLRERGFQSPEHRQDVLAYLRSRSGTS